VTVSAGIGYRIASLVEPNETLSYDNLSGAAFAAEVGYRYSRQSALGLHLGYAHLSGSFTQSFSSPIPLDDVVYDIDGVAQATTHGRLWGAVVVGLHLDHYADGASAIAWRTGLGAGLEGGVDVVKLGLHRLGLWTRVEGTLASASGYAAVTFGAGYRL
jgi:hypothetical protein